MLWNPRSLRVVGVLVLTVALAGPVASAGAAGHAGHDRAGLSGGDSSPMSWEAASWSRMESLWSFVRSALGLRPDAQATACGGDRGAGLDPNGCGTGGTTGGGDPTPAGGAPSHP
jgi:hypothetical protein